MKTTFCLSMFLTMFLVSLSHALPAITGETLLQQGKSLVGKTVCVQGVVDHIEKDGLDPKKFILVLEGPIYCRLTLAQLNVNGYRCTLNSKGFEPITLTVTGSRTTASYGGTSVRENHVQDARIFEKGETLTIMGVVKPQGSRYYLGDPILKDSNNPTVRLIIGLPAAS